MEFLGDACLQLIASHYIFYGFPGHNEGHLTVRDRLILMVVMETLVNQVNYSQQQIAG